MRNFVDKLKMIQLLTYPSNLLLDNKYFDYKVLFYHRVSSGDKQETVTER